MGMMTCGDVRVLIRGRMQGAKLRNRDAKALDAHLQVCSACRAEADFEALIAETITEQPAVIPPASFAANVVAALPAQQPVHLPEPSFRWLWGWAAGGVGGAFAASWIVWRISEDWVRSEPSLGGGIVANMPLLFAQVQHAVVSVHLPLMSVLITALIAFTAWGATALAQPSR